MNERKVIYRTVYREKCAIYDLAIYYWSIIILFYCTRTIIVGIAPLSSNSYHDTSSTPVIALGQWESHCSSPWFDFPATRLQIFNVYRMKAREYAYTNSVLNLSKFLTFYIIRSGGDDYCCIIESQYKRFQMWHIMHAYILSTISLWINSYFDCLRVIERFSDQMKRFQFVNS